MHQGICFVIFHGLLAKSIAVVYIHTYNVKVTYARHGVKFFKLVSF